MVKQVQELLVGRGIIGIWAGGVAFHALRLLPKNFGCLWLLGMESQSGLAHSGDNLTSHHVCFS